MQNYRFSPEWNDGWVDFWDGKLPQSDNRAYREGYYAAQREYDRM